MTGHFPMMESTRSTH